MKTQTSAYHLSKRDYYADFVTVPFGTVIAIIWLFTNNHAVGYFHFFGAMLFGLCSWTVIEYAIHRWVFHGTHRTSHALHHKDEEDFIGVSPAQTGIIGAIVFWGLTEIMGACLGVGLLVGLVLGYLAYIFVHDRMHHADNIKPGSWLGHLKALHDIHHRKFAVNYGVTTPFWDIVFGTFKRS